MKNFLAWLRCRLFGHARMKRQPQVLPGMKQKMVCPRCGAEKLVKANGNGQSQETKQ